MEAQRRRFEENARAIESALREEPARRPPARRRTPVRRLAGSSLAPVRRARRDARAARAVVARRGRRRRRRPSSRTWPRRRASRSARQRRQRGEVPGRDDGLGRGVLRLRRRRLGRSLPGGRRLGGRCRRGGPRAAPAVPQPAQRHVRRRHRRVARIAARATTAWAPAPATWTTTAASTSTSPATAPTRCIATPATACSPTSPATAGVGLARWSTSCAFLDMDRDGDLDLFVANYLDAPRTNNRFCGDPQRRIRVYCHPLNYKGLPSVLYRNNGKGVFTDVSAAAGIAPHVGNGLGVAVGDYDDDGLARRVRGQRRGAELPLPQRGRRPLHRGRPAGRASSVARDGKPRAGMGTEFADYNGDGRLDLVVTNHEFETHSLFRNDGGGVVHRRHGGERPRAGRRCRSSASASRSSTSTTTARWIWRSSTATSSTTPRVFRARLHPRAAQAAVPQPERPALAGDRARGRARVRAPPASGARSSRATWTTTATSTCW